MLPKIVVGNYESKSAFCRLCELDEQAVIGYESDTASVDDFRKWLNTSLATVNSHPEYSLVIWEAHRLSKECQAVLLKPMEELSEKVKLYLSVENENLLLPTILSRGEVWTGESRTEKGEKHWAEIRNALSAGPAACIALADKVDKEELPTVMEEVVWKLKSGLKTEVNAKRLEILGLAMSALAELKSSNTSPKLVFDNFLLGSWRVMHGKKS